MPTVKELINIFKKGGIVAVPTDTSYALSCEAVRREAVTKVFNIKKRPLEKQLPILVSSINMAKQWGKFNESSLKLAQKFWPGSLTIVVPATKKSLSLGSHSTIAMRMPNSKLVLELIEGLNSPIIGTSANISGHPSATEYEEVANYFQGKIDMIVKADNVCSNKHPHSTIVKAENGSIKILREGPITQEMMENALA